MPPSRNQSPHVPPHQLRFGTDSNSSPASPLLPHEDSFGLLDTIDSFGFESSPFGDIGAFDSEAFQIANDGGDIYHHDVNPYIQSPFAFSAPPLPSERGQRLFVQERRDSGSVPIGHFDSRSGLLTEAPPALPLAPSLVPRGAPAPDFSRPPVLKGLPPDWETSPLPEEVFVASIEHSPVDPLKIERISLAWLTDELGARGSLCHHACSERLGVPRREFRVGTELEMPFICSPFVTYRPTVEPRASPAKGASQRQFSSFDPFSPPEMPKARGGGGGFTVKLVPTSVMENPTLADLLAAAECVCEGRRDDLSVVCESVRRIIVARLPQAHEDPHGFRMTPKEIGEAFFEGERDVGSIRTAAMERYNAYVLGWLRYATTSLLPDVIYLAGFLDDPRTRLAFGPLRHLRKLQALAEDMRSGSNVMRHYLSGEISLLEMRRWSANRASPEALAIVSRLGGPSGSIEVPPEHASAARAWLWNRAAPIYSVLVSEYRTRGPFILCPSKEEETKRVLFRFLEQHGALVKKSLPSPSEILGPNRIALEEAWTLDLERWHEAVSSEILSHLADLLPATRSRSPLRGGESADPLPRIVSAERFVAEVLSDRQVVLIDHRCDGAAKNIIDEIALVSRWVYHPGDDSAKFRDSIGHPDSLREVNRPERADFRLPIVLVRRVHRWNLFDFAELLMATYVRNAQSSLSATDPSDSLASDDFDLPVLVIEGDTIVPNKLCALLERVLRGFGRRIRTGCVFGVDPSALDSSHESSSSTLDRSHILDEVNGIGSGRRVASVFSSVLERPPSADRSIVVVPYDPRDANPLAACIRNAGPEVTRSYHMFSSIHELMQHRSSLPVASSIIAESRLIKSFEELYFIWQSTRLVVYVVCSKEDGNRLDRLFI